MVTLSTVLMTLAILSPEGKLHWVKGPNLIFTRYAAAACTLDNKIYVAGGKIKGVQGVLGDMEILYPDSGRWKIGPKMKVSRAKFALVPFKGKLYAIGGEGEGGLVKEIEVFDPKVNKWEVVDSMPVPSKGLSAVTLGKFIYVISGEDFEGETNIELAFRYNPLRREWKALPPIPTPRHAAGVAAVEEEIYVIGGWSRDEGKALSSVEIFNTKTGMWRAGRKLPLARYSFACGLFDGEPVVIGGLTDEAGKLPTPSSYILEKGEWKKLPGLITPRGWMAFATLGNEFYTLGGLIGEDSVNSVEILTY